MIIEKLYASVLKIRYEEREKNLLTDEQLRKDFVYEMLVRVLLHNEALKKQMFGIVEKLETQEKNPTSLAFCAYVYALNHEWERALLCMEQVITQEEGENLDSWIDYGHFLRKIPEQGDLSTKLLLNVERSMNAYQQEKYTTFTLEILKQILYGK